MTRERAKELLPVIQAFAEGKTIQLKMAGEWTDAIGGLLFSDPPSNYRIKPEPREVWMRDGGCYALTKDHAKAAKEANGSEDIYRLYREVEGVRL